MKLSPEVLVFVVLVLIAGALWYASSSARAMAPAVAPSPAAPVSPPEPDMPKKCGYYAEPSAITGVHSRTYICCHPRPSSGASISLPGLLNPVGAATSILGQGLTCLFGGCSGCLDS